MNVAAIPYRGSERFDVVLGNPFWICESLCDSFWDGDLVDAEVWVGRNDCATRKIDTLSGKVSSESALFPFEPLAKTSHRFLSHLGWDARQFRVDVHCNRHLQEFPLFLEEAVRRSNQRQVTGKGYHELGDRSTFDDSLLDESVREDYLGEFDGDIVFVRSSILSHGRTNANRGNRYILPDVLLWPPKF